MSNKLQVSSSDVSEKLSAKIKQLIISDKEKETRLMAENLGLPYINLVGFPIAQEALRIMPEAEAKSKQAIPFLYSENEVRIGVVDSNIDSIKLVAELQREYPAHYLIYLISKNSFNEAFKHYAGLLKIKAVTGGVAISGTDIKKYQGVMKDFAKVNEVLKRASMTDTVTIIIAGALDMLASDIHVEAEETDIKVRYRIDGVLYTVAELNKTNWPALMARLKLLAKLKINVESKPQDGRFTISLDKDKVDVRVSTIPTSFGESVVMRLLRSSATGLQFDDLGMRGRAYDILNEQIKRPNGMILTSGPTGSGKTTTLYAILNKLNNSETKIITLEDPVEYKLQGINQSQVDYSKGYDFATGLKAILRQDPDIVMVGEIRDPETAEIAINAALTGHLVISTIHTNSAAGSIPRLLSMGAKPFLMTPALDAIIGQRLVRILCKKCKVETKLDETTTAKVKKILSNLPDKSGYDADTAKLKFYTATGCKECNNLGYKGRIGIYEVLTVTPEVEKAMLKLNISESEVAEVAIAGGMITMVQDGVLKALEGITSLEEVFSVAE